MTNTQPTPTATDLARDVFVTYFTVMGLTDERRARFDFDALLKALAARGLTIAGPGMVVIDEEDFSFLWRAVKAAEALRDDVQWPRPSLRPHALNISFIDEALTVLDNVRAALSAPDDQPAARPTEDDLYNQIGELLTALFPRIGATDDAVTEFITEAIAKVESFHGIYRLSDREVKPDRARPTEDEDE
jgi:hypothetical protein